MTDERNVRGRLKRFLSGLDRSAQSEMARLFVRHASNLLPTDTAGQVCTLIDLLDAFAVGKIDVTTVDKAFQGFLDNEWSTTKHGTDTVLLSSSSLSPVGSIMQTLLLACCQRELKAERLIIISTRYQPDAFAVGIDVALTFSSTPAEAERELQWQLTETQAATSNAPANYVNRSGESGGM